MARLGDLAEINPRLSRTFGDMDSVSFLGMADVSESGITNKGHQRSYGDVKKGFTAFQNGDLLVAKITPCFENGKIAQAELEHDQGFGSTEFHVVRAKPGVDARYLLHLLRTPEVRLSGELRMTGSAGQRRVPKDFLEQLDIPLPPLPEQRRIASILDQADFAREQRHQALVALDQLEGSVFETMFAAESQADVAVQDLLHQGPGSIRTGPFGSQLLKAELTPSGVQVLGIDTVVSNKFMRGGTRFISEEKYAQLKRYTVHPGDVLITIMGTVGRCVVVPADVGRAINTKHLVCITLDQSKCLPEYLQQYFLRHPVARQYLRSVSKGAIMDGLNMGLIRAMPVVLPALAVQQRFVEVNRAVDALRTSRVVHLALLDELFASLQHRAFRGEL